MEETKNRLLHEITLENHSERQDNLHSYSALSISGSLLTSSASSLLIAHSTASSTSSASCVGMHDGAPCCGEYTPVLTRIDSHPAPAAPAISINTSFMLMPTEKMYFPHRKQGYLLMSHSKLTIQSDDLVLLTSDHVPLTRSSVSAAT
jgi:hypothetical protein